MSELSVRIRLLFCAIFAIAAIVMMVAKAKAQEAEPRAYTNTPIGLNFLLAGYVYTHGKMAFDPELAIADAQFQSHTGALAYVRSFELFGQSDITRDIGRRPRDTRSACWKHWAHFGFARSASAPNVKPWHDTFLNREDYQR